MMELEAVSDTRGVRVHHSVATCSCVLFCQVDWSLGVQTVRRTLVCW